MLFMPTNVIPDVNSGVGNGVIDATSGTFTVSWNVNGTTAMSAYKINVYKNNTASTSVLSTGWITLATPFYGRDSSGNQRRFESSSITIPAAMTNGNEYKIQIYQRDTNGDEVVQSSMSVFLARKKPVVSIGAERALNSRTITSRFETFIGTLTLDPSDSLEWFRWKIISANTDSDTLLDTGSVYGSGEVEVYYDGFLSGNYYYVELTIRTSSGYLAGTGWVRYKAEYESAKIKADCTAKCVRGDTSAICVEWDALKNIDASVIQDARIEGGRGVLDDFTSRVEWYVVGGESMHFDIPWCFAIKTTLMSQNATIFKLSITPEGSTTSVLSLQYTLASRTLKLYEDSTAIATVNNVDHDADLSIIITEDKMYLRRSVDENGLYPLDDLYPSDTLYPIDSERTVSITEHDISYTYGAITKIAVNGYQLLDLIIVSEGELSDEEYEGIITEGLSDIEPPDGTVFYAPFEEGFSAGTIYIAGERVIGWAVYRKSSDGEFVHIVDTDIMDSMIYDYGTRLNSVEYTYYVYPIGTLTYAADAIVSNRIKPCYWKWCLIEAEEHKNGMYKALKELVFGMNLSSGSMSNNNKPSIAENFTRYPTVQKSVQNYKSGSLTSLIGTIDHENGCTYSDDLNMRNVLFELSTSKNQLFLKDRKGELLMIELSDAVSIDVEDDYYNQAQNATLSWVEVGSTNGVSITKTHLNITEDYVVAVAHDELAPA